MELETEEPVAENALIFTDECRVVSVFIVCNSACYAVAVERILFLFDKRMEFAADAGDIIELDNGDMVSFTGAVVDLNARTVYVR